MSKYLQDLLGRRGAPRLCPKKTFQYRGTMFCGECACLITAEEKRKRLKDGSVRKHIYYHSTHNRACTQRGNLTEEDIKQQYKVTLSKYTILPQFQEWALEELAKQNELETIDFTAIAASQNKAIAANHAEMSELIRMAAKKLISYEQFTEEKKRLTKGIKHLNQEDADLQKRANTWYATAERLFDLAVHGRERFLHGTLEEKRTVLRDLGQNPVIIDEVRTRLLTISYV